MVPHDGVYRNGSFSREIEADPGRTLVMACCDPAKGLLAAALARAADVRLIAASTVQRHGPGPARKGEKGT